MIFVSRADVQVEIWMAADGARQRNSRVASPGIWGLLRRLRSIIFEIAGRDEWIAFYETKLEWQLYWSNGRLNREHCSRSGTAPRRSFGKDGRWVSPAKIILAAVYRGSTLSWLRSFWHRGLDDAVG